MQEIIVQAKAHVELFRGNIKGSGFLPVSPVDGYQYHNDELTTVAMNEADETGNNVIYFFTFAQRRLAA